MIFQNVSNYFASNTDCITEDWNLQFLNSVFIPNINGDGHVV